MHCDCTELETVNKIKRILLLARCRNFDRLCLYNFIAQLREHKIIPKTCEHRKSYYLQSNYYAQDLVHNHLLLSEFQSKITLQDLRFVQ